MIVDLERFLRDERPYWRELEVFLGRLEADLACRLTLVEVRRLHYLYQRASSDLARVATFSAEPATRGYLEALVARAYGHLHAGSRRGLRFRPGVWLMRTFPQTVRRQARALAVSVAMTLAGVLFGGAALVCDPAAREVLLPFAHLQMAPAERVSLEESGGGLSPDAMQTPFAAYLMTNNVRVSVFAMAAGMTYGVGTAAVLFGNGVLLGAVCADYVQAGYSGFLAGWLLPHGAIEIPAVVLAGQAGLVLAGALIGAGDRRRVRQRLREAGPEVVTLIGGVAVMLVWAAGVEAFLSQHHAPLVPYWAKILFGMAELSGLILFLGRSGRSDGDGSHG